MAIPAQQSPSSLIQRFNALPNSRKLGVMVAVAAIVALIAGAVLWSRTPDYRVLFSNLSERDAGSVIASLQQMNVPFKAGAGGTVMVPSDQVYDLRFKLAAKGLPKGGSVGFELLDNPKLGMTQFQEQVDYQRALEGELARTIEALDTVASARVHLAIPKPSVFIREQQKPSASVLVDLYSGRTLERSQVSAIVHLVASSVPNLDADHVTVVDQSGNLLTAQENTGSLQGLTSSQLDYLRELENYYARRVESIITPIVGPGNVKAEVQADLDFSVDESTSESYKPNPTPATQAVRSQQTTVDTSGASQAGGVAGALSNQPPGPASAPFNAQGGANTAAGTGSQTGGSSKRNSITNYELDKTIRHVSQPVGRIKRLSVAVVINYQSSEPDTEPTPLSPQLLAQVTNLVKDAVGYDQARGDTINVVNAAFSEPKPVKQEAIPIWKDPANIALAKELLKNLLIFGLAFYLVFGVLRPLLRDLLRAPPATAPSETGNEDVFEALEGGMTPAEHHAAESYQQGIGTARVFAKENPKVVAEVVKEWMGKE